MEDMFMQVQCPCCLSDDNGIEDSLILLGDKEQLKKETNKYLDIFKDHPYIFNLGHGVLPETDPNMVDYLVKLIKDFK